MRHMTLFNTRSGVLLIASLIGSCLLLGCASNYDFERFYKPATTLEVAPAALKQPRAAPPQLVYSHDPDRDGKLLRQYGYALIGTTSFYGADDLPYAEHAAAQGQKVGAGIVLLNVRYYSVGGDAPLGNPVRGATYFSSYWAKSDAAKTSEPQ